MEEPPLPTFIHAGAQKAGSTWIHYALREHPEVFVPDNDNVSFFDVYYHRGEQWYREQFRNYDGERAVGEESPGYLKHPLAPSRASKLLPDAKIVVCLRNPIDRAFSQWWHAQKNWTSTRFEASTNYHAANGVFVTPGYYDYHLSRWEEHFPSDQIHITFFDDFVADNEAFIQDIYEFIGVDDEYTPSIAGKRIKAGADLTEPSSLYRLRNRLRRLAIQRSPRPLKNYLLAPVYHRCKGPVGTAYSHALGVVGRSGYDEGMDPEIREELEHVYYASVQDLEDRTGRDLSHWFEFIEPDV